MNNNLTYTAKIYNIINLTEDTKMFTVTLPQHFYAKYKAGQYIVIDVVLHNKNYRRNYSIVSIDSNKGTLSFIVKRIPNGMVSRHLNDHVKIGDAINCVMINGYFTLPENISDFKSIYFFAAGSGIAPIIPMIHRLANNTDISIRLLYSSKNEQQTIFFKEINLLQDIYSNFHVDYLWSETGPLAFSRLNNTLLTSYLEQHNSYSLSESLFYMCGPLDYMDTIQITLLTEGVPKSNIRKELYFNMVEEEGTAAKPDDTSMHKVTIHFPNGNCNTIQVQYPNSILTTAQQQGLPMPYSCGSGQCGSCTAKIKSGKVWMAYNEVLTDTELAQGYTLTCQGFPIEGDVVLEF